MAKINIDEFLSTASPKDVILLYFTYLAGSNISNYTGEDNILNLQEVQAIRTDIQKIVKYKKHNDFLNNLVIANRSYLYMYPHIVGLANSIKYYHSQISYYVMLSNFEKNTNNNKDILLRIEDINREIPISKDYIMLLKSFLKKYLPLKPYRDFLNSQEKIIIEVSKMSISIVTDYINSNICEIPEEERENYYITPYSEIEVNITKERLMELNLAGK